MSDNLTPLGQIDCRGMTRSHPNAPGNTDQFVVAEVRPSLHVRESSLSIDDASQIFGGAHGLLLLIADGIGDRESGERASTVAANTLARYLVNSFDVRHELNAGREQQLLADLRLSLLDCRAQMLRELDASDRFCSMDTTITMCYVVWPRAYFVHVGNNRAYHSTRGSLHRLTSDHTVKQQKQPADRDTDVWNALGTTAECSPDSFALDIQVGDALMLCSDGVFNTISESEMQKVIDHEQSATGTCERILESGNDQQDDATVIVARFLDRVELIESMNHASIDAPETRVKKPAVTHSKTKTSVVG